MKLQYMMLLSIIAPIIAQAPNEFIKKRAPRISISKLKEDAADIFSCQLRVSSACVEQIGTIQVQLQQKKMQKNAMHERLNRVGTQLRNYRIQLSDLQEPITFQASLYFDTSVSISGLLAHITSILGAIQRQVITHLENIFEDKSALFCKKQRKQLPEIINRMRTFTAPLHELKKVLKQLKQELAQPAAQKPSQASVNRLQKQKRS